MYASIRRHCSLVLLFMLAACAAAPAPETRQARPIPAERRATDTFKRSDIPPWPISTRQTNTWTDNFEKTNVPLWDDSHEEGLYQIGYDEGMYRMHLEAEDYWIYSYYYRFRFINDIEMQITAEALPSTGRVWYGLLCRGQSRDDAYLLRVSNDNVAQIVLFRPRSEDWTWFEVLAERDFSDTNISTQQTHRMSVGCVDEWLRLQINGKTLLEVRDTTFDRGWVGLLIYNERDLPVELRFDDFVSTVYYE